MGKDISKDDLQNLKDVFRLVYALVWMVVL